ncbi:MAG: hypothetical protein N5P05_000922 [Chroococcopsis gigantea SAG 12.99]|jgi:hypothetical protein|nr:hypothetical protein [Chroococcopsis gigantea SAG 12.99]
MVYRAPFCLAHKSTLLIIAVTIIMLNQINVNNLFELRFNRPPAKVPGAQRALGIASAVRQPVLKRNST